MTQGGDDIFLKIDHLDHVGSGDPIVVGFRDFLREVVGFFEKVLGLILSLHPSYLLSLFR